HFSAHDALTQFGVAGAELEVLREAGLHGRSAEGECRYARHDLHYIGLRRGLARDVLAGIHLWRTSLEQLVGAGGAHIQVSYLPKFSGPVERLDVRVILPDVLCPPVGPLPTRSVAAFTTTVRTTWPTLPADVAAVAEEIAALD